MAPESTHRRIARNTTVLYLRMLVVIVISLYTSRVIIKALGVSDYGIYGLVAGVVGMLSFLNASMSGATSRFLTYEMGRGDSLRLRHTFANAWLLHAAISGIVLVLAETVGLWFINCKLVIAPDKMIQANIVYQFSVLTSIISILQVPYSACVISHERMSVFAYAEIVVAFAKLIISYIVTVVPAGRLEFYAALMFAVSLCCTVFYIAYSKRRFSECRLQRHPNFEILRPMISFSGWDMFGNLSTVFNFQGYGIAMNMFYGTIINAAYGIAATVQGVLKGVAVNVVMASRPQIIKQYAAGNMSEMNYLVTLVTRLSLTLYLALALPMYREAGTVLHLWLGIVPEYAVPLLRIVLVSCLFNVANVVLNIPVHATGRVKVLSFSTGVLYFVAPVVLYLLMRGGIPVEYAFTAAIVCTFATLIVTMGCVKYLIRDFSLSRLVLRSYLPILVPAVIYWTICKFVHIEADFLHLVTVSIISAIIWGLFGFLFCINSDRRRQIIARFQKLILCH